MPWNIPSMTIESPQSRIAREVKKRTAVSKPVGVYHPPQGGATVELAPPPIVVNSA
jgi:hypothetical protein